MLPDDLRHLERPGFVIFTQQEVEVILCLLLAGLVLIDLVARAVEFFR